MLFNLFYKELYIGKKEKCFHIINELKKHNIKCKLRSSVNIRGNTFTPFNSNYSAVGDRNIQQKSNSDLYYIYVKKSDISLAEALLNGISIWKLKKA